jgi:hypothetical protein
LSVLDYQRQKDQNSRSFPKLQLESTNPFVLSKDVDPLLLFVLLLCWLRVVTLKIQTAEASRRFFDHLQERPLSICGGEDRRLKVERRCDWIRQLDGRLEDGK